MLGRRDVFSVRTRDSVIVSLMWSIERGEGTGVCNPRNLIAISGEDVESAYVFISIDHFLWHRVYHCVDRNERRE